jgi:hypothetical protein
MQECDNTYEEKYFITHQLDSMENKTYKALKEDIKQ